jgi:Ca2+-binding RTX toxin-like protein
MPVYSDTISGFSDGHPSETGSVSYTISRSITGVNPQAVKLNSAIFSYFGDFGDGNNLPYANEDVHVYIEGVDGGDYNSGTNFNGHYVSGTSSIVITDAQWRSIISDGIINITYVVGGNTNNQSDNPQEFLSLSFDAVSTVPGAGPAQAYGTSNADALVGGSGNNTILGFQGNDTISGLGGNDLLVGGMGDDSISYGVASGVGSTGSSLIYGSEGADSIVSAGGSGSNTIVGGTGIASIDATADGADYIDVSADSGRDLVLGNYGDDTIFGPVATISGGFGSFDQSGSPYDTLVGGYGNDILVSGVIQGVGPVLNNAPVLILGNQGSDTVDAFGPATVYGGQGDDFIQAASSTADLIIGGEGGDTIGVFAGNITVLGGTGNAAVDSLAGALGDGSDYILLGVLGTAGNDLVLGNYGDDTIDASAVNAGSGTLVGGMGNDVISVGGSANDLILGSQGDDIVVDQRFGKGVDTIYGGQGNDGVIAGSTVAGASALVFGGEGNNNLTVTGSQNNTIYGGVGATDAVGNSDGTSYINLSGVAATAAGGASELVFGGSGNDFVSVGGSANTVTITGGAGSDTYYFGASSLAGGTASVLGSGSGLDSVTDFVSGADKFSLAATASGAYAYPSQIANLGSITATSLGAAAGAAITIADTLLGASAGGAATFQYGGSGYIVADTGTDGQFDASSDILINIGKTTSLTRNDFV